jgi:hypothetical protein
MFNKFLFPKILLLLRKCGKDSVDTDRTHMTIWRMRITCWIPKSTNTHSEYVRNIEFPPEQRLQERVLYVHFLSCLIRNFFYCSVRVTGTFFL